SVTNDMDEFVFNILNKMLSNMSLEYRQKIDYNNNLYQLDIFLKETTTNAKKQILSLLIKDDVAYVQAKGLFELMNTFGEDGDYDKWSQTFRETEWVSMSKDELDSLWDLSENEYIGSPFDFSRQLQQKALVDDVTNQLMSDVLTGYETGCVKKSGNKYVLTLTAEDVYRVFTSLSVYCLQNIDSVDKCLHAILNNLTDEQLSALGMDEDMKKEALQSLDKVMIDMVSNQSRYQTNISESNEDWDKAKALLQGSKLVYSIERTGSKAFNQSAVLDLFVNNEEDVNENAQIKLTVQSAVCAKSSINIAIPANAISLTELEANFPTYLEVEVDYNYFTLEKGFQTKYGDIEVKMIDDYAYLPLRQASEALGETVLWDEQTGIAYIEKNGQKIEMSGINYDGILFVKAKDFENLGYQVNWDDEYRTVTIEVADE
ncbi:MAG: hypothetical protein H6Q64_811, partial [Firmicutes bacterium]|nr:hypothetical protein [Bacillota bacterium]